MLRGGYRPQTMLTSEAKMDVDPRMPQFLHFLSTVRHLWKLQRLPHQPSLKISAYYSGSPHFPSSSPVPQPQREHLLPVWNWEASELLEECRTWLGLGQNPDHLCLSRHLQWVRNFTAPTEHRLLPILQIGNLRHKAGQTVSKKVQKNQDTHCNYTLVLTLTLQ